MAKLEKKSAKADVAKQTKAKKRKHIATEQDEEVASKSLIVEDVEVAEAPQEQKPVEITAAKATKRKHNKSKSKIKEKRSKTSEDEDSEEVGGGNDNENATDGLHEPTLEQLRESEKPENTKAVLTVRQKKKQKHQQRVDAQKDQSVGKERQRNEEYLNKWKTARAEWKFEKLRQISIQQSVFEEEKIGNDIWPIALEYLSGSKGAAKDKITKLAEDLIDQLDKQCGLKTDEQDKQAIVESSKYQRARNLLQSFD